MHIDLGPSQKELVAHARDLARKNFAPRALSMIALCFPCRGLQRLFKSGLLRAAVPQEYGGLGWGPIMVTC